MTAQSLRAQGRADQDRPRPHPGQVGEHAVPECRTRQSELDRHDAARGVLPARPVRAGGMQARLGRAGPRRHAPAQGLRAAPGAIPEAQPRTARARRCWRRRSSTASSSSASTPTPSSTSSPTPSSATTTRCRAACSCTASASSTSSWRRRCATAGRRRASSTSSRSRAARRPCATSSTACAPTASSSPGTRSRWARRSSRPTSR